MKEKKPTSYRDYCKICPHKYECNKKYENCRFKTATKNVYIVAAEAIGDRLSNPYTTIYGIFTKDGLERIDDKIKDNNVFIIPLDKWIRNGVDLRSYVAFKGKFAMARKLRKKVNK